MIFLHELGHYLTAKWSGMKVTEFFLFFGPKIWSFKRGETEYGIKCIPARRLRPHHRDEQPRDRRRRPRTSPAPTASSRTRSGCSWCRPARSCTSSRRSSSCSSCLHASLGVPGNSALRPAARRPGARRRRRGRSAASTDGLGRRRGRPRGGRRHREHRRRARRACGTTSATQVAPDPGDDGRRRRRPRRRDARARGHPRTAPARDGETDGDKGFLGIAPQDEQLPDRARRTRSTAIGGGRSAHRRADGPAPSPAWRRFFTGGVDDFAADVAEGGAQPSRHRRPTASAARRPPARTTSSGSCRSSASPASAPASSRRAWSASSSSWPPSTSRSACST